MWTYVDSAGGYLGWHLTADGAGCARLVAAIDALAGGGETKPLVTSPPTEAVLGVPNNRHAVARPAARLRLVLDGDAPDRWRLEPRDGEVVLTLGRERLAALRQGVDDVSHGRGDYAIGSVAKRAPKAERLWFWWMPDCR